MKKWLIRLLCSVLCVALLMSAACLTVGAAEENEPQMVSVCINGDASSVRGFCWYTETETDTCVQIYLDGALVNASLTFSDVRCEEWKGKYMHKVTVSGLQGGKEYTYCVGDGNVWSNSGKFVTDDADDSFSFIAIADIQASSIENFQKGAATLAAAFETMPDAEFVVNCGDFTNDSTYEEWTYYDTALRELNMSSTLAPVAGNHDGLGVYHWFDNMFCLDASESVQTLNGVNYSFDYGNAHFAVLNTNDMLSISDAQLKWLRADMKASDKDWKIVAMHKSPYTLGKDGKWPDALYLQDEAAEAFDECNVDLVLSGHDHMYLRTKPLTDNSVNENGTVYVLCGTAGSKRYEVRSFLADSFLDTDFIGALTVQKGGYGNYWNGTDWSETKETNIGGCFNCISVDGGSLTFNSYILADGSDAVTSIDSFTITKQVGLNVAEGEGGGETSSLQYAGSAVTSVFGLLGYTLFKWLPVFLKIIPDIIRVYSTEGTF